MNTGAIKLSLILNYFVFAILLNSVGSVILQVQSTFGVSEQAASVLEAFKDFSIAVTSFLVASFIARLGYKRVMLFGIAVIGLVCLAMPQAPVFWMNKLLFAAVGFSFALTKVSVFATIGLVTNNRQDHASFMNFLEGFFMVGVLSGYFVFSAFVDDNNPASTSWFDVYYALAGLLLIAFVTLLFTRIDESQVEHNEVQSSNGGFFDMLKLCLKPLVMIFVISVFLYVLIEQSIMTWLPTFNSKILHLPASLSIQMASILAASTALGRFFAGFVLKKIKWYPFIVINLLIAAGLVLVALPLAQSANSNGVTSWFNAPLAAYLFPIIGFCIAPVYPAINSAILSSLPNRQHASMAGLIVIFSALGGTTGSIITGSLFEHYGGITAFYCSLIPIGLILVTLFIFNRQSGYQSSEAV